MRQFKRPINLSVLHNYFDNPTKLFSDLYLVNFLDTLAKLFFFVWKSDFAEPNHQRTGKADLQ